MTTQVIQPPRAPTEQLRLESFKTLSKLQLVSEFRPWIEYSREHMRRRVDSPYFVLWDCICFGAPLNTLLELIGSPTPRHLAVSADEFDFGLAIGERTKFFASFIYRVQSLEAQGQLSFGEVLRVNDFMEGQNAGFWRVLKTINRILSSLQSSYPGLFSVPHGSEARRASLMKQLKESEISHVATLALTADFCATLYEDPRLEHPALEGFIVSCSRLIPYHDHVLNTLLECKEKPGCEPWDYIFSLQNKVFFTQMRISYQSICTNYLAFQTFAMDAKLAERQAKFSEEILRNLSSVLMRFFEYQNFLLAIVSASSPMDSSSYDSLCTVAYESSYIVEALSEAGRELRTMTSFRALGPRFGKLNPLDSDPYLGTLLLDDCLIISPENGLFYSVFLFETRLLCCLDHRRRDTINLGTTRYPVRPWEMGPAMSQRYPLHIALSIPTTSLKRLHCIDTENFELSWGDDAECSVTFYPTMHHQFTQWTSILEQFVSRVVHSTSVPEYIQAHDGASVYSGRFSLIPTSEDDKFSSIRRQTSVARPWSLIGRKGPRSETSSMINFDLGDNASILSPDMLPGLFTGELPRSPLRQSFLPDTADDAVAQELSESPRGPSPEGGIAPLLFRGVPDLTGEVIRESHFPVAHGGYSDVWKGLWKGDDGDIKVAVKVLRSSTSDQDVNEKLARRLERELEVWQHLSHPHVLPLCGIVSDFGPYISMICPWFTNGSVTKYLERSGDIISVEDRLMMICEVAEGLAYLHSRAIVHGDLSGSNILVDDNGHVCLCDFGLSTLLIEQSDTETEDSGEQESYSSQLAGSVRWADASLFRSFDEEKTPVIRPASDIYSFGSVMLEILSGRVPYHYLRTDAQVVIQLHQGIKPRRPATAFVDDAQWEVIERCWGELPEERPSALEVSQLAKMLLAAWTRPNSTTTSIGSVLGVRKSA